jgi:hypothetical protein
MLNSGQGAEEIIERVHLAPVLFEIDRLVLPFFKMKGERMHLIPLNMRNERSEICLKVIRDELEIEGKQYEIHRADFDLYQLVVLCKKIIEKELKEENHVFVNLSSGGAIQAIASLFATLTFKNGVSTYYAYPERFNEVFDKKRPQNSTGLSSIASPPHYPIIGPNEAELQFLKIVAEIANPNKKSILDVCEREGLISSKGKSKPYGHVILDNRFLRPLENQGLMMIDEKGRRGRIHLTEKGRSTLQLSGMVVNL